MTTLVPDSDALRRAALQASWRRGRWVARRRLVWRWVTWASVRIVLPVALFVAAVAAATPWVARLADDTPSWMSAAPPTLVKVPASAAPSKRPADAPVPAPALAEASAQTPVAPAAEDNRPPGTPGLRLDLSPPVAAPAPPAPSTTNVGDPRP